MSDYLRGKRVVNPVLTSITRGYKNAAFIDERTFPVALTDKEGVRVPTFGKTALVEYSTEHAVGAGSSVLVRGKIDTLDLVPDEHDLAAPVDYRGQAESMFNEGSKTIRHVTNGVNLRRELIVTRLVQDGKVYRTEYIKELTVSNHWAGGEGDPIGVTEAGMGAVRTATGLRPNLVTMGAGVMALLKFHPAIQAAIGANGHKRITTRILQDLFQIGETVIGAPVSLSSIEATMGKSSMPAGIWGDNLMLCYVDKPQPGAGSVDENEPSFDYTLRHRGMLVADRYGGAGGRVEYCCYTNIHEVAVVGGDVGYLITGTSK